MMAADDAEPTFFGQGGRGRCLDFFALGPELAPLAGQMTRHKDTHIYGHCPVSLHLSHSVKLRAVTVLKRPRVPKGPPVFGEGPLCKAIEEEMAEFAKPSPIFGNMTEVRESYRVETEARWARWNELSEKWRWASITGKEPPAAAKGHGAIPMLVKRDLRPHEAKLEFTDLDFCELALVTVLRRLEHVVGLLDKHGERSREEARGHLAALGRGHWNKTTRCEQWRERIDSLSHCGNSPCDLTLLQSRQLLEDLRLFVTKVNNERKQERIVPGKKLCEKALQGSMATEYRWLRRKTTDQVLAIHAPNGEITQDPEKVAEGAIRAWADLWRAQLARPGDEEECVQDSLDDLPLPPLSVQEIRVCLALDSWTTAELKSLPNVALQGLLHLYGRFEALGCFPPGAQCVLKHWHPLQGLPCVLQAQKVPVAGLAKTEKLDMVLGLRAQERGSGCGMAGAFRDGKMRRRRVGAVRKCCLTVRNATKGFGSTWQRKGCLRQFFREEWGVSLWPNTGPLGPWRQLGRLLGGTKQEVVSSLDAVSRQTSCPWLMLHTHRRSLQVRKS